MAAANFERALSLVLKHEGGFADHPADPGGATMMGITQATLAQWRGRPVGRTRCGRFRVSRPEPFTARGTGMP